MYIVTCVYNTLSRWARRLDNEMVYLTVSLAGMALGFAIFVWGIDQKNATWLYGGAIIIGIAILMEIGGLRIALREQKDQEKRWKYLIALLKAIAMKMGVDITRINDEDSNND